MFDDNHNGLIDRVLATFTNAVNSSCANNWSSNSIPSGGKFGTPSVSGTAVTVPITEKNNGTPDTSASTFSVTFSPAGGCNAAGFSMVPADKAPPVPISVTSQNNGTTVGKMEAGDTFTVTFSEPVTGVPTLSSVSENNNGPLPTNDFYTISGVTLAALNSGSNYTTNQNAAVFTPSTNNVVTSGAVVAVTVGGTCSGGCASLQAGSTGSLTFTPAPTITDVVPVGQTANVAVGNGVTPTFTVRLF
jgi:hypothetical protein